MSQNDDNDPIGKSKLPEYRIKFQFITEFEIPAWALDEKTAIENAKEKLGRKYLDRIIKKVEVETDFI